MRSCAACRAKMPASQLVRFACEDGQVRVDLKRRVAGRGVHLGPARHCLAVADKRRVFQRVPVLRKTTAAELIPLLSKSFGVALERTLERGLRGGACHVDCDDSGTKGLSEVVDRYLSGDTRVITVGAAGLAARLDFLIRGASEFTFNKSGGMKRRLWIPRACNTASRPVNTVSA